MKFKAHILIVDDDPTISKGIAELLTTEGHHAEMASDGAIGLEKINKKKYAVIIIDLKIPGLSGMELLEIIKRKRPDSTVIMITGYPSIKSAVQAIKMGAYDFLSKPFPLDELLNLIERALERRHIYEEMAEKIGLNEEKLVDIVWPSGQYYTIPDNSWVKTNADGTVSIGAHHIFIRTIHNIKSLTFPKTRDMIRQGDPCVVITDMQGRSYNIWAPVSGRVAEVNRKIATDTIPLIKDPYQEGWLLQVEPTELKEDLIHLKPLQNG
jgi:ActR/RegA family two-component response regulator/glycine cleavage system H lipoate-binding protein